MPPPPEPKFQLPYTPSDRRPYNVLLLVIDDLRADRLSAYGNDRETSPNLARRLATGTRFTACHSPVGWTLPGCASIITGHPPDSHGLVDHNKRFMKPKIGHFLGEGYRRVGIANNGNVVSDRVHPETLERLGLKRRPAKWRFFGWDAGFDEYLWTPREDYERPFAQAREFLETHHDDEKPWFLFFHTNVVHDYHMDRPIYLAGRDWLDGEVHPALTSIKDGPEIWAEPPPGLDHATERRHLMAKYDAGIRHMDSQVEELLARVDFESTIVVFMSDHGEGFDPEVGRVHHCGRLHNDLTSVPLVVWMPEELRRIYDPPDDETRYCSTIDVVPTLLTLLGDAVSGFPGQFLFDLPTHRRLSGCDRGYVFWNEDCIRESYDTSQIEIRSELTYPLKRIMVRKNDAVREYVYNLAYDPGERDNLATTLPKAIDNFEPITFIVAVNDWEELRENLLSSPIARSRDHQWLLVDNTGNAHYESISQLYDEAQERAEHDLIFFIHQDVLLPDGWERRMFESLAELERADADWGVLGAVGALPPLADAPKQLRGHWCDPSGYHRYGPLPHEVQSLDEQWLGVRGRSGVRFDPKLPGFHCYGLDLSMTARAAGKKTYALDAFVWHKHRDTRGLLIERREHSGKIQRRWSDEFMAEFQPSANYVEEKWTEYLPFQTTSWNWGSA